MSPLVLFSFFTPTLVGGLLPPLRWGPRDFSCFFQSHFSLVFIQTSTGTSVAQRAQVSPDHTNITRSDLVDTYRVIWDVAIPPDPPFLSPPPRWGARDFGPFLLVAQTHPVFGGSQNPSGSRRILRFNEHSEHRIYSKCAGFPAHSEIRYPLDAFCVERAFNPNMMTLRIWLVRNLHSYTICFSFPRLCFYGKSW